MKYSLTIFKNTFDNKTHRSMEVDSWDAFEGLLYGMKRKEGEKGGNNSVLLLVLVVISKTLREVIRTLFLGSSLRLCLDVDDFRMDRNEHSDTSDVVATLEKELEERFGEYYYVCYSTASSTEEQPKFRLVFPLTKEVVVKDLPHFWFAMNKEFKELGDEQTKDVSRMYYVPAIYPNAYNFIFTNKGVIIDPEMLMEKHSYVEKKGDTF